MITLSENYEDAMSEVKDLKRYIENLKCCGNCKAFSDNNPLDTCELQKPTLSDPAKRHFEVCDRWSFDGLTKEERS